MGTQIDLTQNQISVLLWLKVLNDFNEDEFVNSTFDEKYQAFETVEDIGISRIEYESCVDFWVKSKILSKKRITDELSISKHGEKLFDLLEQEESGKVIALFLKEQKNKIDLKTIGGWVTAHYMEIVTIIGTCIQTADFVLTHF